MKHRKEALIVLTILLSILLSGCNKAVNTTITGINSNETLNQEERIEEETTISIPKAAIEFTTSNYEDAKKYFDELGFKNIELQKSV